jgi:hypothetical protein
VVRQYFPTEFDAIPTSKRSVYASQVDVNHRKAVGLKKCVGYVDHDGNGKVWVWALLIWDEGIIFYKGDERIKDLTLTYVCLQEPGHTLVGKLAHKRAPHFRAYIEYDFLCIDVVSDFIESKTVPSKTSSLAANDSPMRTARVSSTSRTRASW